MKKWKPSVYFKAGRLIARVQIIVGIILFFYNYLIHDYLGIPILVYLGWPIGLFGLMLQILAHQEFRKKGRSKDGDSLSTTVLVTSGIYAVVRHPMYVAGLLMVLGALLISQHWLTLILGVPLIFWFLLYVVPNADMELTEKFGDEYKRYSQKVPGVNFITGLARLLRLEERS